MEPQANYQPQPVYNPSLTTTPWKRFRPIIIIAVIVVILGLVLNFVANHGYVTIQISGASTTGQTVNLLDQNSNVSSGGPLSGGQFKRFVKRSEFEASASGNGSSGWAHFKSGGFLRNTVVSLTVAKERSRTFVGDDPKGCMNFDQQLISYDCGADEAAISIHNASSGDSPPYVTTSIPGLDGKVMSIVTTPKQTLALMQQESEDENFPGFSYSLVPLASGSFNPTSAPVYLDGLKNNIAYYMKPYKQGVVVYTSDFSDAFYFANATTTGTKINLPTPPSGMIAYSLESSDSTLVVSYTTKDLSQSDSLSKDVKGVHSQSYIVNADGSTKTQQFSGYYSTVLPCGNSKLCVTTAIGSKQQMIVMDPSGNSLKKVFAINNVNHIFQLGSNILVVSDQGVLRLNIAQQTGTFDLTFGNNYTFCGTGTAKDPSQYVLCLTAKDGGHAVLINTNAEDTNQIDQKIASLRSNTSIDKIIADRNNIFIVPNYGDQIYDSNQQSFVYDPTKSAAADAAINSAVSSLKLKELGFNVVNVLQ